MGNPTKKIYASVKAFSQRGKLLSKDDFQTLSESRDMDELITRMKNTKYSDIISYIPKPYNITNIERALKNHLIEMHFSIAKTSGEKVLSEYYLRYVLWNLKLIIKGKILGKSYEDIESQINLRAEELIKQRDTIVKTMTSSDLEEAVTSLRNTVFGEGVSKAVNVYNDTKNIQVFDIYFDKILTKQIKSALQFSSDRDIVRLTWMNIDFYNLVSILRGKFWDLTEEQINDLIVTSTPSASKGLLSKMASASSIKDACNEISNTRYKNLISTFENDIDLISDFEHAFEIAMYKASKSSFTTMFSPSNSMGIINLLNYEVRNISSIIFAIEQKIPSKTTMSKLII
ncbi:MAG: V-type ATPase subunit [Nitrosopumilaceae archaeon]|nr:V-type ATPase subunit [Nitrosopumilaceae archaeon]